MDRNMILGGCVAAAVLLGGCSAPQGGEAHATRTWRSTGKDQPASFHYRLGAGDALGLALFGREIQVAKATTFGDSVYANVDESASLGE